MSQNYEKLPMIALRGLSVFPSMILNFDIERPISVSALDLAMAGDRRIFLLAQRDPDVEEPGQEDLYTVGCIATVRQILRMQGGGVRVLAEGKTRATLNRLIRLRPCMEAEVEPVFEEPDDDHRRLRDALMRRTRGLIGHMSMLLGGNGPIRGNLDDFREPGALADFVAQNLHITHEKKQSILETLPPLRRLEKMNEIIEYEIEVLEVEGELQRKVQGRMMASHRESILREQLRSIQQELGMDEEQESQSELDEYRQKIEALPAPEETKEKLLKELGRLAHQGGYGSSEGAVLRTYLDKVLELPWGTYTEDDISVEKTRRILDEDHYGLEKVKERILEYVAVRQLAPELKGAILCLVGPPGTGKTSIGMSIARAMGRKLSRISLGGVHDEAEIRGHRKTYVGAMPGRIMNAVAQAGSMNPVILLDEVDKLGTDYRGDPSSALLEALDSEQNHAFRDHYLEVPFDLSDVLFITTANNSSTIPRPLLDRMEVIELGSYTDEEKLHIARDHLLPKQRKKHGLKSKQLKVSDAALRAVISGWTQESGVRTLERELGALCRKAAVKLTEGADSVSVRVSELENYLGVRKYKPEEKRRGDTVGLARGLAWTSVGGVTLDVEVAVIPGTGMLRLTGNLGEVMKESAAAGMGYIRSRAALLGIDPDFYKTKDILVHFPEGAVPKDGPSAGITMTLAMISALTGAPVRGNLAMTGEITLRGRILAIGGLKEKTMAALRAGADTVIIPKDNEHDLMEIDRDVREKLSFITASHIDDVLRIALDFTGIKPWKPAPASQPGLLPAGPEPEKPLERSLPN